MYTYNMYRQHCGMAVAQVLCLHVLSGASLWQILRKLLDRFRPTAISLCCLCCRGCNDSARTRAHTPVLSCYVAAAKRSRRPVRGMKQNSYWSPQCGIMPLVCSYALLALPCCGTTCCKHCTGWLLSVHTPASASLPCTYGASCHTPF